MIFHALLMRNVFHSVPDYVILFNVCTKPYLDFDLLSSLHILATALSGFHSFA